MRFSKSSGFTLIELMIVLIIAGILTSIAIPSWQNYVVNANRVAAKADLNELSLFMERQFTARGRYDDSNNPNNLAEELPFNSSPQGATEAAYNIAVNNLAESSYFLSASPTGVQEGDEVCGELRIDHAGTLCINGGAQCSNSVEQEARNAVADCF